MNHLLSTATKQNCKVENHLGTYKTTDKSITAQNSTFHIHKMTHNNWSFAYPSPQSITQTRITIICHVTHCFRIVRHTPIIWTLDIITKASLLKLGLFSANWQKHGWCGLASSVSRSQCIGPISKYFIGFPWVLLLWMNSTHHKYTYLHNISPKYLSTKRVKGMISVVAVTAKSVKFWSN